MAFALQCDHPVDGLVYDEKKKTYRCSACPKPQARAKWPEGRIKIVLDRVSKGESNSDIAASFGIAELTLTAHMRKYAKSEWKGANAQRRLANLAGKTRRANPDRDARADEALALVKGGLSYRAVGEKLDLSPTTVAVYVREAAARQG